MPRYAALLRAINVGGHVVTMDRLRGLVSAGGFDNVQTVIASGNVLFDAAGDDAAGHERDIERLLEQGLGYPVATFVRTPGELAALASMTPFGPEDGRTINVTFLRQAPDRGYVERLLSFRSDTDDFLVLGRESWWACRGRTSDSPYGKRRPDTRTLGTTRNITTVRKLAARFA